MFPRVVGDENDASTPLAQFVGRIDDDVPKTRRVDACPTPEKLLTLALSRALPFLAHDSKRGRHPINLSRLECLRM